MLTSPLPFDGTELPLHIPEFQSLGMDALPLSDWARHCLATGESGSGKTRSCILPLLAALLKHPGARARDSDQLLPFSMLVFDPKREIGSEIRLINAAMPSPRRLVTIGEGARRTARIDLFEGERSTGLTAEAVVSRILSLSVPFTQSAKNSRDNFWNAAVENTLRVLVAIDMHLAQAGGVSQVRAFWRQVSAELSIARVRIGRAACVGIEYARDEYLRPHLTLLRLASVTIRVDRGVHAAESIGQVFTEYTKVCRAFGVADELILGLESIASAAQDTFSSIVATLDPMIAPVTAPAFTAAVSLNPLERPPGCTRILGVMERGDVVVVTPPGSPASATSRALMRAVKSSWYRLIFRRRRMDRPVAIIADEAHQVITNDDEESAEGFVLDRCRAFRTIVVLATQSIAALQSAMHSGQADADTALQSLLTNTATKLAFRSTDPATHRLLRTLFPFRFIANRPHVIDVRPPVSLRPGEAYVVAASGAMGRGRVALGAGFG